MGWPFTYGTAVSPVAASTLDTMFNQVAAGMAIPCTASGTNAISLTPAANFPALTSYNELGGYRFKPVATTTAAVTAQFNGLGFLPAYKANGTTQLNIGDLVIGQEYVLRFSQSLNSGGGGFFAESPAIPIVTATGSIYTPGGRITPAISTPVVTSTTASTTLYYAPYQHQFVPIYNGTNIQMYNFCSSTADTVGLSFAMAGSATWPANSAFDLFITLVSGNPTMCSIAWTNPTTRATTLSVFGGFLTNSGSTTAQTASGPITLSVNQGTFIGSFFTSGSNGQTAMQFAGSASGGVNASLYVSNYYNLVMFNTVNVDTGAQYAYSTNTIRVARASPNNVNNIFQCSSERTVLATYSTGMSTTSNGTCTSGIGFNTSTVGAVPGSFLYYAQMAAGTSVSYGQQQEVTCPLNYTGFGVFYALEISSSATANVFDLNSINSLRSTSWQ